MKRLFTLLAWCSVLSLGTLHAQLPNGTIAPNFTTTDLDGNEFTLYDKLDEGYTVILDFSATWCGPCWAYAQAGILDEVWEQYGPEGTQEFYVIKIEGDPRTTLADINGTGDNTQGNWLSVVSHPIANDDNLAQTYAIGYWPTIYTVCPNRVITETGRISTEAHYSFNDNCLREEGMNNGALLLYGGLEGAFCGDTDLNPSIRLQNLGTEALTAASVEFVVDGTSTQTMDWTGDLATYELATVEFDNIVVSEDTEVTFNILSVNGGDDTFTDANTFGATATRALAADQNTLAMQVVTDQYSAETYWEIVNDAGTVLYSGGNIGIFANPAFVAPGTYDQFSTNDFDVVLPADGCYYLRVVDFAGDGMCCAFGDGGITITNGDVTLAAVAEFDNEIIVPFEIAGATTISNNAQLVSYTGAASISCGDADYTPSFLVQNIGTAEITSMQLSVSYDGGVTTEIIDWTGSIMASSFGSVSLDAVPASGALDIVIEIVQVNGEADNYDYNNILGSGVTAPGTTTNEVTFSLRTDFWPEEIDWELRTGGGDVITSAADFDALGCDEEFTTTFNLDLNECYVFSITDAFDDGLINGAINPGTHSCNTPNGQANQSMASIELSSAQGVIFDDIAYGAGADIEFIVNELVNSVDEISALGQVTLYPNPVSDLLNVSLNLEEKAELNAQVFNAFGQQVRQLQSRLYTAGKHQLQVDVNDLQAGMYYLRMQDGDQISTYRFTVQH